MRKITIPTVITLTLLLLLAGTPSRTYGAAGEAMGNPYLAGEKITTVVAEHYGIKENTLVTLAEKIYDANGYPDDVLATLFLARAANADPLKLNRHRSNGMTWQQLYKSCGVNPKVLFKPVDTGKVSRYFKNAYNEYDNWKKNPAGTITLSDREFRYLSGMRFVSDRFREDPLEVMNSFYDRITFTLIIHDHPNL